MSTYTRRNSRIKRAKKFKPMSMEEVKKAIDKADKRLNGAKPFRNWWQVQKARNKNP